MTTSRINPSRYRVLNAYHWLGQPATAVNVIPASAGATVPSDQIMRVYMQNISAGTVSLCLAGLFPDSAWTAGQWVAVGTTLTDDTTDAQDAGTNDFPINTTTINDGHIIGCTYPFGLVSYDMTTATIGAALAGIIEYWNGAAWTEIAETGMLVDIPRGVGVQWATGELIIMFDPPADWAVGGSGTGVSATKYNLRYASSAAGTTAGLARRIYVGVPITSWRNIATLTEASVRDYSPNGLSIPDGVVRIGCAANLAAGTVSTVVATNLEIVY
ncbi:MAG: hypothetical protein MUP52_09535 [Candidatus Aminicenantes bacterium]|nr:hypothetical protein [Candidatus Aminicenantes bacterium]